LIAEDGARPPVATIAPGTALGRYLDRTRDYGFGRFVAEMSALALVLRIPAVWLAVRLGVSEDATTALDLLEQYPTELLVGLALVGAPIMETALFQWFPIALVRRVGGSAALAALVSALLFAALHFQSGMAAVLVHVPTGLVLAWSYLAFRHRSLGLALLAPAAVHFLLNLHALSFALRVLEAGA
jgi:membrane protease YdiL (CAAX protease family)